MILRRDGLMTSVNILRLYLPNYCQYINKTWQCLGIVKEFLNHPTKHYLCRKIDDGKRTDRGNSRQCIRRVS